MPILQATDQNIERASQIIRSGGVVAFPTETVYGLGADALNEKACAKIFEIKNRPFFDPLIVHISDYSQLDIVSAGLTGTPLKLAEKFWPGPLTVVIKKSGKVPLLVTSGLNTVAVRMPSHNVALELIRKSGTPIAAPSANPFGYLSPTCAQHVHDQLGEKVPLILDGGDSDVGVESTIIKFADDKVYLLRPGGISLEELVEIAGNIVVPEGPDVEAPGQLPYHYSPVTPVKIFYNMDDIHSAEDSVFLFFKTNRLNLPHVQYEILSEKGDMTEAASRLFACLHRLDSYRAAVIYVESMPETGLGLAIMDRLRKASGRKQI